MKIKLENREYELKANGAFMKKYQETFNENMIIALYKCTQEKDVYTCAKLTYCAIEEEMEFDEWINSFEAPLFILPKMEKIIEYLTRECNPTVENKYKQDEQSKKKKMK